MSSSSISSMSNALHHLSAARVALGLLCIAQQLQNIVVRQSTTWSRHRGGRRRQRHLRSKAAHEAGAAFRSACG